MQFIQKWARGRHPLLVLLAPQMVSGSQDFHSALVDAKKRRLGDYQFPLPHLPSWFRLYRSHRRVYDFVKILFAEYSTFGPLGVEITEDILEVIRLRKIGELPKLSFQPTGADLEKAKQIQQTILDASFKDLTSDLSDEPLDPELKENFLDLLGEVMNQASFFVLVMVPCWLLYRIPATRLYRKKPASATSMPWRNCCASMPC